jgi:hypothetical protein
MSVGNDVPRVQSGVCGDAVLWLLTSQPRTGGLHRVAGLPEHSSGRLTHDGEWIYEFNGVSIAVWSTVGTLQ